MMGTCGSDFLSFYGGGKNLDKKKVHKGKKLVVRICGRPAVLGRVESAGEIKHYLA